MLINQINESLERLKIGASAETAKGLKKDLDALYEKIKSYEERICIFMKNTVETENTLNVPTEEKVRLINTLHRFVKDSIDGKTDLALQDLQNIDAEVSSGNKELKQIWSNYRAENFAASQKLIAALNTFIDEDIRLDQLGELRQRIETKSIGDSGTVEDIKRFRELTSELIDSKKMKPEVQDFINKLASGEEVLLSSISDEVYKWIKENKLDKKIVVAINS